MSAHAPLHCDDPPDQVNLMDGATFKFHGELNFFLPPKRRHKSFVHPFKWRTSIKDMIESLGPPHSEIDFMRVDGQFVDFDFIVPYGTSIEVYDYTAPPEIHHGRSVRLPLGQPFRFVLDTHLGRLANYLRMMGFDTLYRNDYPDDELAHISHTEGRILLTRDIGLLKRSLVIYGRFLRSTQPRDQLLEIIRRYNLRDVIQPFRRCLDCNGTLHPVDKYAILDQLPHTSMERYDEFHRCDSCGKVYWKGTHYSQMTEFIEQILAH